MILRDKFVFADGGMREMVLWQLPEATPARPHALKYRLHFRSADGTTVVRYDNERGKGDHRHRGDDEEPYRFVDVETLVADFLDEVATARGEQG